jgi:hypothetical protein
MARMSVISMGPRIAGSNTAVPTGFERLHPDRLPHSLLGHQVIMA